MVDLSWQKSGEQLTLLVTRFTKNQGSVYVCFNPRTHVGYDLNGNNALSNARWFQSTHPRGVRLAAAADEPVAKRVSIHAPARGATPHAADQAMASGLSIHAPARGATRRHLGYCRYSAVLTAPSIEGTSLLSHYPVVIVSAVSSSQINASMHCTLVHAASSELIHIAMRRTAKCRKRSDPSPPHKAYVVTRNTVLPFPAELSVTERGGIPYGASERMEEVR